jgi:hypothetical protein
MLVLCRKFLFLLLFLSDSVLLCLGVRYVTLRCQYSTELFFFFPFNVGMLFVMIIRRANSDEVM